MKHSKNQFFVYPVFYGSTPVSRISLHHMEIPWHLVRLKVISFHLGAKNFIAKCYNQKIAVVVGLAGHTFGASA